jgi:hypothetical protein
MIELRKHHLHADAQFVSQVLFRRPIRPLAVYLLSRERCGATTLSQSGCLTRAIPGYRNGRHLEIGFRAPG